MGTVVHFELATDDPQREADFFAEAFGWKIERWGEEQYWLADTGEGPGINGAIEPMAAPDSQRTVNTFGVDDADAAIARATAAGATVVTGKEEVPGIGWTAVLSSPTGIVFGIIQPLPGSTMG